MKRTSKTTRKALREYANELYEAYSHFSNRCFQHEIDAASGKVVSGKAESFSIAHDLCAKSIYLNLFTDADAFARKHGA